MCPQVEVAVAVPRCPLGVYLTRAPLHLVLPHQGVHAELCMCYSVASVGARRLSFENKHNTSMELRC